MNNTIKKLIAFAIALAVLALLPAQVFADSITEYVYEVKVFYDGYEDAQKEGFTILKDKDNNIVDLNRDAGGGAGSQGDRAVYLGYKTTTDKRLAITDLALMNMKGGYKTADYDYLMQTQMDSQIMPFVRDFIKTLEEYRQNLVSDDPSNKERAEFIRDILNKMTDDDTGKCLGDLLINKTKQELSDEEYKAMSPEEQKEHADLATIIAQADGKATMLIENLLTRAADTNPDTWMDRFARLSYDDLIDQTGLIPTDAARQLAKLYDDDANTILSLWEDFRIQLNSADEDEAAIENSEETDTDAIGEKVEELEDNFSEEAAESIIADIVDSYTDALDEIERIGNVSVKDYLSEIEYMDGTMLDFFMQDSAEIEDDITVLYPLVASLTAGQRAGMELFSLKDLVLIAGTDEDGYDNELLSSFEGGSIYAGVDREIYKKGGVALTSDALRADALANQTEESNSLIHWYSYALMGTAGIAVGGFVASFMKFSQNAKKVALFQNKLNTTLKDKTPECTKYLKDIETTYLAQHPDSSAIGAQNWARSCKEIDRKLATNLVAKYQHRTLVCKSLAAGFAVAFVIISGITTWLTWEDMKDYYKVDFTPVPRYMVEEKDIVGYNARGEKVVLKNQSAYYKLAESNAKSGDFKFDEIGSAADMNGCYGKQWLALYTVKNRMMQPILASSLVAAEFEKAEDTKTPSGYKTCIHMFGSDAPFNLNSSLYDWDNGAPGIFVYFKTDDSMDNTTGTTFTGGTLALTGGAGIVAGSLISALALKIKKKED